MIAEVKGKDKQEILVATLAKDLDDTFPKLARDSAPVVNEDTMESYDRHC